MLKFAIEQSDGVTAVSRFLREKTLTNYAIDKEIEVITSGFGAQYGNAQSGVVNITMKEGKSDKWRARFESRMRNPAREHWGPGVFDVNANPYMQKLSEDTGKPATVYIDSAVLSQAADKGQFDIAALPEDVRNQFADAVGI